MVCGGGGLGFWPFKQIWHPHLHRRVPWSEQRLKKSLQFCTNHFITPYTDLCLISVLVAREAELRRLRKANIEFEEQNRVLQRHIKDMYNAKERLEVELGMDEKRTQALHQHLLTIKQTLVSSLSTVPLPGQQSAVHITRVKVKVEMKTKQQYVKIYSN